VVQKLAVVDSVQSALAAPNPNADGSEANLRVDSFGNTHVVLHGESAASTPEPLQSNTDITVLASAARTTLQTGSDITNTNHRGIVVVLDVTLDPAAASITVTIQGKDTESSSYYTLLAGAAVAATGTTAYTVYPGCIAVANSVANLPVPRIFRVNVAVADADSMTYSIGASLIL